VSTTSLPVPVFAPALEENHELKASRNWRKEHHRFDERSVAAVEAALACRRPLLFLGEPGLGKTQLARGAAKALSWPLVYKVVSGRTECEDLLYRFDAVARLARAQIADRTSAGGTIVPALAPGLNTPGSDVGLECRL